MSPSPDRTSKTSRRSVISKRAGAGVSVKAKSPTPDLKSEAAKSDKKGRPNTIMLEENGMGTAALSQSPIEEPETKEAVDLQRKLLEYESESEGGAATGEYTTRLGQSLTKSFSVGDVSFSQTNRSGMRTQLKWNGGDLTKKQIAVRLLTNVARRDYSKDKPTAFIRAHLD